MNKENDGIAEIDIRFTKGCEILKKGRIDFEKIKEFMPENSVFAIHSKDDLSVSYLCKTGQKIINKDLQQIKIAGYDFVLKLTDPYSLRKIHPLFLRYYKFGHPEKPYIAFQRLRWASDADFVTIRTTTIKSEKHQGLLTMHIPFINIKELNKAEKILEANLKFVHDNYPKFYQLKEREKIILCLLGKGYTYSAIAEKLFTSTNNIKKIINQSINEKLDLKKKAKSKKINNRSIYTIYAIHFNLIDSYID